MCSIGVTNIKQSLLDSNKSSQRRGPDDTNIVSYNNIQFLHNLLHLTGDLTSQPFYKNDIVALFNGEIYNYLDFGSYKTDGEILIDLYEQYGNEFTKQLDGEYAICLVDFKKNIILIATDAFACKPLWYEFKDDKFCIASYNSQLTSLGFSKGQKLYANTTIVYNLDTYIEINKFENYTFDINQYKTCFDDWITAFENSIQKRTKHAQYGIFLGLSSGYDSGAISCELLKQNTDFRSYTITGPENMGVVNNRTKLIPNHELINLTSNEYNNLKSYITNQCEDFIYEGYSIKNDKASFGLAAICTRAANNNERIYLSGQGADEIISDYGYGGQKIYGHSGFGGKFPNSLDGFFPWNSFYDGTQIKYLNKEEYIAGHYGIETRYPFLDPKLVQEFIWLKPELKNSKYKSALDEYLTRNQFPFAKEKIGFNALKGLK